MNKLCQVTFDYQREKYELYPEAMYEFCRRLIGTPIYNAETGSSSKVVGVQKIKGNVYLVKE